jgi:hypothetical protein
MILSGLNEKMIMSKDEFIDAVLFALFIIVPFVIYWS